MKKKISCVTSLLGIWGYFFISPIAAVQPSSTSLPSQWRIGVGLAGEYMNSEANLNLNSPISLGNIKTEQSQTAKKLQLAPCIELGATIINDYYLALLVSWRYSGAKNTSRSPLKNAFYFLNNFRLNQYADFFVKMGYILVPQAMIYGLVGPSLASWTHTTDIINGNQMSVNKFKMKKTSLGVGIGVGFEYCFQKKYAIGVDYTHYFHKTASRSRNMSYGTGPFYAGDLVKNIRPSYSTIAIRFTTYFQL
jgi:hypothetical protein